MKETPRSPASRRQHREAVVVTPDPQVSDGSTREWVPGIKEEAEGFGEADSVLRRWEGRSEEQRVLGMDDVQTQEQQRPWKVMEVDPQGSAAWWGNERDSTWLSQQVV